MWDGSCFGDKKKTCVGSLLRCSCRWVQLHLWPSHSSEGSEQQQRIDPASLCLSGVSKESSVGFYEKSLSVIQVFGFFPPSTVKPTVVDVDIFVNSIGPVSSINMVSQPFHPLLLWSCLYIKTRVCLQKSTASFLNSYFQASLALFTCSNSCNVIKIIVIRILLVPQY